MAAGGRLGWRNAGPLPSNDRVNAVAAFATPGQPVAELTRRDELFGYQRPVRSRWEAVLLAIRSDDDYAPGNVEVHLSPVADPTAVVSALRGRLDQAGWHVGPLQADEYGRSVAATRDGVVTRWDIRTAVDERGLLAGQYEPTITMTVQRADPAGLRRSIWTGGLIGVGLALVFAFALKRRLRTGARRQQRAVQLGVLGGILLLPAGALITVGFATELLLGSRTFEPNAPWAMYMTLMFHLPAVLGCTAIVAAAAWGMLPTPRVVSTKS
jgi:hypothetical protein